LLLNEIWQLQSKLTNYFYPQQKLISKVRAGAKCPRNTTRRPPRFTA